MLYRTGRYIKRVIYHFNSHSFCLRKGHAFVAFLLITIYCCLGAGSFDPVKLIKVFILNNCLRVIL